MVRMAKLLLLGSCLFMAACAQSLAVSNKDTFASQKTGVVGGNVHSVADSVHVDDDEGGGLFHQFSVDLLYHRFSGGSVKSFYTVTTP